MMVKERLRRTAAMEQVIAQSVVDAIEQTKAWFDDEDEGFSLGEFAELLKENLADCLVSGIDQEMLK